MGRITISDLFDTQKLNGKKNGGVKIYVPTLTATTFSDGRTGYTYTGGHSDAKRIIYKGNTLYNISWDTNLDAIWYTTTGLDNWCAEASGLTEAQFATWAQQLTAATTEIHKMSDSQPSSTQDSDTNNLYVMIRTVTSGDANTYTTNFLPISIEVSGVSANSCTIRAVSMGNTGLLNLFSQYFDNNGHFSSYPSVYHIPQGDAWLTSLFRIDENRVYNLEQFYSDAVEAGLGSNINFGPDDKYSGIAIVSDRPLGTFTYSCTKGWIEDTSSENRWYVNTNCGDGQMIGQCMLFNIQLPTNTGNEAQSFSFKFILNESGTTASASENPTDTAIFSVNKMEASFDDKYSLSGNGVGYYFRATNTPSMSGDDSTISVSASTSDWTYSSLSAVNYAINTYVTYTCYCYQKGDSTNTVSTYDTENIFTESVPDFIMSDTPTLSVDEIFDTDESSPYYDETIVPIMWKITPTIIATYTNPQTSSSKSQTVGSFDLYVYNDLSTINNQLGRTVTYETIANSCGASSYPGKAVSTTYTYSITTTQAGCTVKIGTETLTTSSEANSTYSTTSTATNLSYSVSKTNYDTASGTINGNESKTITLTESVTYYTYTLTVADTGATITMSDVTKGGESAWTSTVASASYQYITTDTSVRYWVEKTGYKSVNGTLEAPNSMEANVSSLEASSAYFSFTATSITASETGVSVGVTYNNDNGYAITYLPDTITLYNADDESQIIAKDASYANTIQITLPANTSTLAQTYTIMLGPTPIEAPEFDDTDMFVNPYDTLVITQEGLASSEDSDEEPTEDGEETANYYSITTANTGSDVTATIAFTGTTNDSGEYKENTLVSYHIEGSNSGCFITDANINGNSVTDIMGTDSSYDGSFTITGNTTIAFNVEDSSEEEEEEETE